MKEHPILFSDQMVRAILAGTKTQTRRLRTPARSGDRLWVREGVWCYSHERRGRNGGMLWPKFANDSTALRWFEDECEYTADMGTYAPDDGGRLNKLFMPRWASRIDLDVLAVRQERLQDITEAGAVAEGFERREHFIKYWDGLRKTEATTFAANPCVWVIEFRRNDAE